jgi:Skp family chaperone for outer membrane proteins
MTILKKTSSASRLLLVALFGMLVPVVAQAELKPPVIAVVDVPFILQESSAGKSIQKAIQAQREVYSKEIAAQEEKLRSAEQELGKQRAVLSQEAFAKKRRDFEKQIADVQREVQSRSRNLEQAFNESTRTVQGSLFEIIAAMVQDQGINMVLNKHQVVLVEKGMDLTQEVLERLNKKLPQVAVKIPPIKK